jgi:hypothetical protein
MALSPRFAFAWWRRRSTFVVLWTLAVAAATTAFVLYLALRTRSMEVGYELGRAHGRVARLREVRRVLELELSSYKTPERVDLVSRTLLGMDAPGAERILALGKQPAAEPASAQDSESDQTEGTTP